MGITGLLPFLSNLHKKVHVGQYSGKCVAVDTSCWLHRGAFSCAFELATGQPTTKYVNYIVKRIKLLLYHKIYPIMVFDGCNTPSKKNTNEKRREHRQTNREKGKQLLAEGNKSGAVDLFQKAISITIDMVVEVIKECNAMNVPVVVAPYEADAQITYLVKTGVADFAITEDSDLLPFGCQKVLFKMDDQGYGIEIDLEDLGKTTDEPRFDGWTIDKFRQMCIISGCDYLDRLPKCGLKTVHKQFRKFSNVDRGIKAFISNHNLKNVGSIDTKEYYEKFIEADQAFKHHLVFDPASQSVIPLNPLPAHLKLTDLPFLGEVFSKDRAIQHACGNINPQTGEVLGSFPKHHTRVVRTCAQWRESGGKLGSDAPRSAGTTGRENGGWDSGSKESARRDSGWASAISVKEATSKPEPSLTSWSPTKTRTPNSAVSKKPPNQPRLTSMSLEGGEDDTLVKIYGSGKRRKIIPSTTEQKSCYFRRKDSSSHEKTEQLTKERKLFFVTAEEVDSNQNPFKKSAPTDSKENVPISTSNGNSPPAKFQSVFSGSSHVVSSHSSAINLQKTVTETLFDQPVELVKSDSQETLTKIPSPIKSVPRTLGLGRKVSQSSASDSKPVQTNFGNKWISTQTSQKSKKTLPAGSKKHPIKIGLTSVSNPKKQRTLNFAKKNDNEAKGDTLSKYF
ncbi:hypothetical protein ACHWQZ_G013192 [Mnemiopsis leidyi]